MIKKISKIDLLILSGGNSHFEKINPLNIENYETSVLEWHKSTFKKYVNSINIVSNYNFKKKENWSSC